MDKDVKKLELVLLVHCWWKYKMVQLLQKTIWWFLKELDIDSLYDPAISLLGICPKEITILKRYLHPHVHCSIITIDKIWKQSKHLLMEEWIKEM